MYTEFQDFRDFRSGFRYIRDFRTDLFGDSRDFEDFNGKVFYIFRPDYMAFRSGFMDFSDFKSSFMDFSPDFRYFRSDYGTVLYTGFQKKFSPPMNGVNVPQTCYKSKTKTLVWCWSAVFRPEEKAVRREERHAEWDGASRVRRLESV